jgi:GNAT superfamily N-acetyltransferase
MEIKIIPEKDLKKADLLQQSILNPENKKRYRPYAYVRKNYKKNPSLFVGCYDNSNLVGITFGYVKKKTVLLGEMAVSNKYRAKGIGSKMLKFFESNVKKLGKNKISLGARGPAEKFYLKNSYKPIIFSQIYSKDVPNNYKNKGYNIIRETNYIGSKRLYIDLKKYDPKIKYKIKKTFNAYNVIYLFEKEIK